MASDNNIIIFYTNLSVSGYCLKTLHSNTHYIFLTLSEKKITTRVIYKT